MNRRLLGLDCFIDAAFTVAFEVLEEGGRWLAEGEGSGGGIFLAISGGLVCG